MEKKKVLKILIVLYNRRPNESETLVSLEKCKKALNDSSVVYVWDNSACRLSDDDIICLDDLLSGLDYHYYWGNGKNAFLSTIYNHFIAEVRDDEYFVIFDHDSDFDNIFFDNLYRSIYEFPDANLYLPTVYSQNKIVSPATKKYFRGHLWKEPCVGLHLVKNIAAINSGMAISGRFLCHKFEGYDEDFHFYGTDGDFMAKYKLHNKYCVITDSIVYHTLNFNENEPFIQKYHRYKELKRAAIMLMKRKGVFILILTYIYYFLYSIKMAIKHHNIKYLY